jgi:uncharacterized protein GlcG (DUF336 family)
MRLSPILLLFSFTVGAQPTITTQLQNGVVRAVVLHASDLSLVTDDSPAQPGEVLILQGSGFGADVQVLAGATAADTTAIDDGNAQFTLPAGAGGGFLGIVALSGGAASNGATLPAAAPADSTQLTAAEVQALALTTAGIAAGDGLAIAIVDRAGNRLAIYARPSATAAAIEKALALARTGAFFSNQQTPLSSRTVRSISRVNFPEGIPNQPSGPLYGIENTNRGCNFNTTFLQGQAVPQPLASDGVSYSQGIATVPGGLALYRNGSTVIGGIGVAGLASDDVDEYVAAAGSATTGLFVSLPLPAPGAVYVNGFQLPFINDVVHNTLGPPPAGLQPAAAPGGSFLAGPLNGNPVPEGWLVGPLASATMSTADVTGIIQNAIATANLTRAAIRLPDGSRAKMVISVADLEGNILGLYRMTDSTVFSIDVAITKARNVVYFSGPNRDPRDLPGVPAGTAVTNRTIGFGGQIYFPSGIWNTLPGPFYPMYLEDIANPCTQGHQPPNPNQSGIVFFPGSTPLYRNGQLIGGLGVSGDGVDQDDFVTSGAALGFDAAFAIRADQVFIRGVRLPFWNFPRNPEQ